MRLVWRSHWDSSSTLLARCLADRSSCAPSPLINSLGQPGERLTSIGEGWFDLRPMILTVGHSRHPTPRFLEMLKRHRVQAVADVRRKPYSRREPQYNRETLAAALAGAGMRYSHWETLGGLRDPRTDSPHVGVLIGVRGFADYMETAEFRTALEHLIAHAMEQTTAILCAEASPSHCHRSLIADALLARGVQVEHILDEERREPHRLTTGATVEGDRIVYRGS